MKLSKNVNNQKCAPQMKFFNENFFLKDSDNFWHRKFTLKVKIMQFLTTFTQLNARSKKILQGWLLALSIKEDPAICAIVCNKNWVILKYMPILGSYLTTLVNCSGVVISLKIRVNWANTFQTWDSWLNFTLPKARNSVCTVHNLKAWSKEAFIYNNIVIS